jgi:hypothetical protein
VVLAQLSIILTAKARKERRRGVGRIRGCADRRVAYVSKADEESI